MSLVAAVEMLSSSLCVCGFVFFFRGLYFMARLLPRERERGAVNAGLQTKDRER